MKQLISDARSKIVDLWNELHLSEEERRTFCAAYTCMHRRLFMQRVSDIILQLITTTLL